MKMKKLLLMITLLAAMPAALMAQDTRKIKALWCEELSMLYFVYNSYNYTTGAYTGGIEELNGHNIDAVYYGNLTYKISGNWPLCRDWCEVHDKVVTVVFHGNFADYKPTSTEYWFYKFSNLTTIKNIYNFITSDVTDMSYMFYNCSSLTTLNLSQSVSNFKTDNVTNMRNMFSGCSSLTSLNVSDFDTSNVTNMDMMFEGCKSLTSLDVSKWNTSNVTRMDRMFDQCNSLTSLDVSKWDTSNVTIMQWMFLGCSSLTSLDVSKWNTSNVTNMSCMFDGCKSLTSLDVSKWNTSNVTTMKMMFDGCESLTSLDVSKWNTSNVTNMNRMFDQCVKLTSLDVSKWNTSNVTDMAYMFDGCSKLTSLDVSKWDTSNVTDMSHMFQACYNLTSLGDMSNWNTSNVTNMNNMFWSCGKLTSLGVSEWNTSNVTNMVAMFLGCESLTSLDVSSFDTRKVEDMRSMFYRCIRLKSLTFGANFAKKSTATAQEMFYNTRCRFIDFSNSTYSETDNIIAEVNRSTAGDMFDKVAKTTVIYLPENSPAPSGDLQNVVYTKDGQVVCEDYYSEDKVDIELPHRFDAKKAQYHREMSTKYGTVILPYVFTSNDDIQAYALTQEHTQTMYFEPKGTAPEHFPFLFEKKDSGTPAPFITEDTSGNYGITVWETRDTELYGPYGVEGLPVNIQKTVASEVEGQRSWNMYGYYVKQTVDDIRDTYYIAGDKFYKANKALTLNPHRVTFKGEWTYPIGDELAPFLNIGILGADGEEKELTAIESAELFNTVNGIKAIYDVQGRRLQQMQPGLNIVHMEDGRILKVKK